MGPDHSIWPRVRRLTPMAFRIVALSLLLSAASCSSGAETAESPDSLPASEQALDDTTTTSTPSTAIGTGQTGTTELLEETAGPAFALAVKLRASGECVRAQMEQSTLAELNAIGLTARSVDSRYISKAIAAADTTAFDAVMLTFSQCTDRFERAALLDLGRFSTEEAAECFIDSAKGDAEVVAASLLGVTDLKVSAEIFPAATMDRLRPGFDRQASLLSQCGSAPRPRPTTTTTAPPTTTPTPTEAPSSSEDPSDPDSSGSTTTETLPPEL